MVCFTHLRNGRQNGARNRLERVHAAERSDSAPADVVAAQLLTQLLTAEQLMQGFCVFFVRRNEEWHIDAASLAVHENVFVDVDGRDRILQRRQRLDGKEKRKIRILKIYQRIGLMVIDTWSRVERFIVKGVNKGGKPLP